MNNAFSNFGIKSGEGLKSLLDSCGLITNGVALDSSQNVIRLSNCVTLNWKSRRKQVRINCKEAMMHVIEQKTNLKHIANGSGDPTHEFSFLLDDMGSLVDVIYVLRHYIVNC